MRSLKSDAGNEAIARAGRIWVDGERIQFDTIRVTKKFDSMSNRMVVGGG